MEITFKCHVRKTKQITNLRPASILITVKAPEIEQSQVLTFEQSVQPTINWVSSSTPDDSVDVTFDLPENYANENLKFTIAVNNNDLLICGYNPVNFEIQTNPLWDGELGPYDITGHSPTGGEMGNGSLIILAGQTVTFDAMYVIDQSILPAQLAHLVTYLDNQQLLPPNCKPEHFDALPSFTWQEKLSQSPLTAEKARTRIGDAQSFHFVRQTMLQKYKDNPAFIEWANKN